MRYQDAMQIAKKGGIVRRQSWRGQAQAPLCVTSWPVLVENRLVASDTEHPEQTMPMSVDPLWSVFGVRSGHPEAVEASVYQTGQEA